MQLATLSGLRFDDIRSNYGLRPIHSNPCLGIFAALWVSETQSSSLNSQQLSRLFRF